MYLREVMEEISDSGAEKLKKFFDYRENNACNVIQFVIKLFFVIY